MPRKRTLPLSLFLSLSCFLLLSAWRTAEMRLPEELAAVEPLPVTGHNPRTWNRPIGFGPYRTSSLREGSEFSWSVEAFGVRGGSAKKVYRMVLEAPGPETWEIECRTRAVEAWRDGFSVELTDAFTPRLSCGLHARGRSGVLRLVLGSDGRELRGLVEGEGEALLRVRSVHHFEGSKLGSPDPVGYVLERGATMAAAVETINRGRVWFAPGLDEETSGPAAAAAAALLLFKADLSPQE